MRTDNLEHFVKKAFNINLIDIKENTSIDVKNFNIKVKSFNHENKTVEYKRVNYLIRKKDAIKYIVNGLECSKDHKFYSKMSEDKEPSYFTVENLLKMKNFSILNNENVFIKGVITKTNEKIPIYDLEIEDNHNLFTDGLLSHNSYGNPYVPAGGESIKYYTALKIELSKSLDKTTDGIQGIVVKAKVTKNKFAPPYETGEYYVEFGKGIVKEYEVITAAIEQEVITKTGNTYFYNGNKLGVGQKQLEDFLATNPELLEEIKQKILEK